MLRHCVALTALLAVSASALAQDPEAEIRFGAGVRLLRDGFPDRALIEIEAALKKDPDNAFYLKGMSVGFSQLADKCKPNDTGCRSGNLKKAIDAAQKALVANPDYVDARNDLGIAMLRLGKRTEGKAELAKAFADPQCPTPEVTAWNLGQAFVEEKDYAEAMTWFQAALNKNKTLAAGYVSIADILMSLGQADAAIIQLEIGMKEAAGNTGVQLALGDAYLKAGRFQDARAAYEGVIKNDPAGASGRQAAMKLQSISK